MKDDFFESDGSNFSYYSTIAFFIFVIIMAILFVIAAIKVLFGIDLLRMLGLL